MFDVNKKILIVNMLILCMFSLFKVDVYASEEINKHYVGDLLIDSKERLTFQGNGGSVTLDYLSQNRSVEWKVKVYGSYAYEFLGTISIKSMSGVVVKSYPISGMAAGNQSVGGGIDLYYASGLRVGTNYSALMTGWAVNTAGTKFVVDDDVRISFKYGY